MKLIFKIKNIIYKSDIKAKSAIHLFDTLVRPIATYGCEVWGAYTTKASHFLDDAKLDGFDSMTFDKLDIKLCENIIGVNKKTINVAVRGGLSRFHMTLFILKQVFKFWMRVAEGNTNSLLEACYLENVNLINNGKSCWLSHVKNIVLKGMEHVPHILISFDKYLFLEVIMILI